MNLGDPGGWRAGRGTIVVACCGAAGLATAALLSLGADPQQPFGPFFPLLWLLIVTIGSVAVAARFVRWMIVGRPPTVALSRAEQIGYVSYGVTKLASMPVFFVGAVLLLTRATGGDVVFRAGVVLTWLLMLDGAALSLYYDTNALVRHWRCRSERAARR